MGFRLRTRRWLPVGVALLLGTCGGNSSPTTPPVVTTTPPPATTLAPAPPVAADACTRIGFGPGTGEGCPKESGSFLTELDRAIDLTVQQDPQAFDTSDIVGAGGYRVLSSGQFNVGVLRNLNAMGVCAGPDGDEIWIKNSNDFHDQYQIMASNAHIRRGEASYRATCHPAAQPKPEAPLPPSAPGCRLPPSREFTCGRDPQSLFTGQVLDAIGHLQQTRPELFNGAYVNDQHAYQGAVVDYLMSRGFCAKDDGDEIAVKQTNDVSEQFQIQLSSGRVRTDGAYRASCYPAAF